MGTAFDDILILCSAAAENAKVQATHILEEKLKLSVNTDKTHITHSDDGVKFLGVEIGTKHTRIQSKQMTKRNGGVPLQSVINALNPLLRGFNYFKIANASRAFKQLARLAKTALQSNLSYGRRRAASIAGYDSMVIKARSHQHDELVQCTQSFSKLRDAKQLVRRTWANELGEC